LVAANERINNAEGAHFPQNPFPRETISARHEHDTGRVWIVPGGLNEPDDGVLIRFDCQNTNGGEVPCNEVLDLPKGLNGDPLARELSLQFRSE
jgi:hypothetical protein